MSRLSALEEHVHELMEWKRSEAVTSSVAALAEKVQSLTALLSDPGVVARGAETRLGPNGAGVPKTNPPPTSGDGNASRQGTTAASPAAQSGSTERLQAYDIEISRSDLYGWLKPTDRVIVCMYTLSGEQCFLQLANSVDRCRIVRCTATCHGVCCMLIICGSPKFIPGQTDVFTFEVPLSEVSPIVH
jgi:hypothetical protein